MKAIYGQHKNCQQTKPVGRKTYIFSTVYLTGSSSFFGEAADETAVKEKELFTTGAGADDP